MFLSEYVLLFYSFPPVFCLHDNLKTSLPIVLKCMVATHEGCKSLYIISTLSVIKMSYEPLEGPISL